MKKVFKALLLLAVISFSSCTKDQVLDVNVPQKSPFEKDLELVATKAGLSGTATLQPYWGKGEITPIFPTPVHVDSLGPGPNPNPNPNPTPVPTPEEEFNADLEYFYEVVLPVMEKHNAFEEFKEQNGEVDINSFFNEDGEFLMFEFLSSTTSDRFQWLFETILTDYTYNANVSDIANDEELNSFEKITLSYFVGYDAVSIIDSYLSDEDEIGTKGAREKQKICKSQYQGRKNKCSSDFQTALFYAEAAHAAILALGFIPGGQIPAAIFGIISAGLSAAQMDLFSTAYNRFDACMLSAQNFYTNCMKRK